MIIHSFLTFICIQLLCNNKKRIGLKDTSSFIKILLKVKKLSSDYITFEVKFSLQLCIALFTDLLKLPVCFLDKEWARMEKSGRWGEDRNDVEWNLKEGHLEWNKRNDDDDDDVLAQFNLCEGVKILDTFTFFLVSLPCYTKTFIFINTNYHTIWFSFPFQENFFLSSPTSVNSHTHKYI